MYGVGITSVPNRAITVSAWGPANRACHSSNTFRESSMRLMPFNVLSFRLICLPRSCGTQCVPCTHCTQCMRATQMPNAKTFGSLNRNGLGGNQTCGRGADGCKMEFRFPKYVNGVHSEHWNNGVHKARANPPPRGRERAREPDILRLCLEFRKCGKKETIARLHVLRGLNPCLVQDCR